MASKLNGKVSVIKVDIAPLSKIDVRKPNFGKLQAVLRGLAAAYRNRKQWRAMYIGMSGNLGQYYELIFVCLGRFYGKALYLHHHSFAYIDRGKIHFRLLSYVAGSDCTHIVLSKKMGELLEAQYKSVNKVRVLSNIVFIPKPKVTVKSLNPAIVIGFMSNISFDKGIGLFFDTLDRLRLDGVEFEAVIAGPFQNKKVDDFVSDKILNQRNVTYIGPIYEKEKVNFLKKINILLFPTMYKNEAEPLTIYECFAYGVPVISLNRGCIGENLDYRCGLLVNDPSEYAFIASRQVSSWVADRESMAAIALSCREAFEAKQAICEPALAEIIETIQKP